MRSATRASRTHSGGSRPAPVATRARICCIARAGRSLGVAIREFRLFGAARAAVEVETAHRALELEGQVVQLLALLHGFFRAGDELAGNLLHSVHVASNLV